MPIFCLIYDLSYTQVLSLKLSYLKIHISWERAQNFGRVPTVIFLIIIS